MAFKMKGWSGSPIKQKPKLDLSTALANIQRNISNTVKGFNIKPQSKSSGFGLTNAQKAQAKKLGISEYQWKTEMGISASTRHKKRMFEKKQKKTTSEVLKYPDEKDEITDLRFSPMFGSNSSDMDHGHKFGTWGVPELWEKTGDYRAPGTKPIWDPSRGGPEQPVTEGVQYHHLGKVYSSLSEAKTAQEKAGGMDAITPTINGEKATQNEVVEYTDRLNAPAEVDYGTGATTKDWKHESSTGWSLHELTQERKNFEVGSAEYKKIQEAINAAYKAGPPVNIESPGVVPANVKAMYKNMTYEAYLRYKDYYDAKASGQPYTGMSETTKKNSLISPKVKQHY